jgi:hypothetical protein
VLCLGPPFLGHSFGHTLLPLYFGPLPLIPSLHIVPELKTPQHLSPLYRVASARAMSIFFSLPFGCAESSAGLSFPAFLANSLVLHHFYFRPGLLSSTSFLSRLASGLRPVISFLLGHHRLRNHPVFLSPPFRHPCLV